MKNKKSPKDQMILRTVLHYLPHRLQTFMALPLSSLRFQSSFTPVLLHTGQFPLQPAVALIFFPLLVLGTVYTSLLQDFDQ